MGVLLVLLLIHTGSAYDTKHSQCIFSFKQSTNAFQKCAEEAMKDDDDGSDGSNDGGAAGGPGGNGGNTGGTSSGEDEQCYWIFPNQSPVLTDCD